MTHIDRVVVTQGKCCRSRSPIGRLQCSQRRPNRAGIGRIDDDPCAPRRIVRSLFVRRRRQFDPDQRPTGRNHLLGCTGGRPSSRRRSAATGVRDFISDAGRFTFDNKTGTLTFTAEPVLAGGSPVPGSEDALLVRAMVAETAALSGCTCAAAPEHRTVRHARRHAVEQTCATRASSDRRENWPANT